MTPWLVLVLIAYFIGTVATVFLPKKLPMKSENTMQNLSFNAYKINETFKEKRVKKEVIAPKAKEYQLKENIVLQAIYASSGQKGWIVIYENSTKKTHILTLGEKFKAYLLDKIYNKYVIFTKNGQNYKLGLEGEEEDKYTIEKITSTKQDKKDIEYHDGSYVVKRDLVGQYTKNIDTVFKEIQIQEITKNGKIDGFKINGLSNKSIFKKLGLLKGDIIKQVNNIELKSYNDAFKIYNQMDKIDILNFQIIRNNQPMEIEYEIR